MNEDDVILIRMILENLEKEHLIKILKDNGYNLDGSNKKLVNHIMTKISYDNTIESLKELGKWDNE